MHWSAQDGTVALHWEEGDIAIVGQPFGPAVRLPLLNMMMQAGDGCVVKAGAVLRGEGQLSAVRVKAGPGSALAGLAGRHLGLIMREATLSLGPARMQAARRTFVVAWRAPPSRRETALAHPTTSTGAVY